MNQKEVFYVRHAKSSWDSPNLTDLERPLNERGHWAAKKMASFLKEKHQFKEFVLISSPAVRAYSTASYFAKELGHSKNDIKIVEELYYGDELDYIKCLKNIPVHIDTVLVFGHNPTIETLVAQFEQPYNGLAPTCSVFHVQLNKDIWNAEKFTDFTLKNYYFPKLVLNR